MTRPWAYEQRPTGWCGATGNSPSQPSCDTVGVSLGLTHPGHLCQVCRTRADGVSCIPSGPNTKEDQSNMSGLEQNDQKIFYSDFHWNPESYMITAPEILERYKKLWCFRPGDPERITWQLEKLFQVFGNSGTIKISDWIQPGNEQHFKTLYRLRDKTKGPADGSRNLSTLPPMYFQDDEVDKIKLIYHLLQYSYMILYKNAKDKIEIELFHKFEELSARPVVASESKEENQHGHDVLYQKMDTIEQNLTEKLVTIGHKIETLPDKIQRMDRGSGTSTPDSLSVLNLTEDDPEKGDASVDGVEETRDILALDAEEDALLKLKPNKRFDSKR